MQKENKEIQKLKILVRNLISEIKLSALDYLSTDKVIPVDINYFIDWCNKGLKRQNWQEIDWDAGGWINVIQSSDDLSSLGYGRTKEDIIEMNKYILIYYMDKIDSNWKPEVKLEYLEEFKESLIEIKRTKDWKKVARRIS